VHKWVMKVERGLYFAFNLISNGVSLFRIQEGIVE